MNQANQKNEYIMQHRYPDYYSIPNGKHAKNMMYDGYKDANSIMAKKNSGVTSMGAGDRFNSITDAELQRLLIQLEMIEKTF